VENRSSQPSWTKVRFGDVVKLNTDRCADPEAEGIERYVGIEHIQPEDLRIRSWGLVKDGTTFTNYFKPGQVLLVSFLEALELPGSLLGERDD
jgi:type I restriction enzyme S subunit